MSADWKDPRPKQRWTLLTWPGSAQEPIVLPGWQLWRRDGDYKDATFHRHTITRGEEVFRMVGHFDIFEVLARVKG